jgi:hypothetical protein
MRRILIVGLALAVLGGCVTASDADRSLLDQTSKGSDVAAVEVDSASAALAKSTPDIEGARKSLAKIGEILGTVKANAAQLIAVFGAPKDPKPFSVEQSMRDREQSKQDHEKKWYEVALGYVVAFVTGGGLITVLSRVAPGLAGPIGTVATVMVDAISLIRKRADEKGGAISVNDIIEILKDRQEVAGVRDLIRDLAKKSEERLGVKV